MSYLQRLQALAGITTPTTPESIIGDMHELQTILTESGNDATSKSNTDDPNNNDSSSEKDSDDDSTTDSVNTESEQMREWANSVYKRYEDRGHYQEQPDGELIDLSLRRYLNAHPQPVKIEEDITSEDMIKNYTSFKKKFNN